MALETRDLSPPRRRELPLWLPWLAAPAFALLPIAAAARADHSGRDGSPAGPL